MKFGTHPQDRNACAMVTLALRDASRDAAELLDLEPTELAEQMLSLVALDQWLARVTASRHNIPTLQMLKDLRRTYAAEDDRDGVDSMIRAIDTVTRAERGHEPMRRGDLSGLAAGVELHSSLVSLGVVLAQLSESDDDDWTALGLVEHIGYKLAAEEAAS